MVHEASGSLVGKGASLSNAAPANNWRAWYSDGRSYTSRVMGVEALPREGLIAVVEYLPEGRKNIYHGEYIWHRGGKWGTAVAKFDAQVYGDQVFPGVLMPDADFERMQREAMESQWP
jgi:hypothetical protein